MITGLGYYINLLIKSKYVNIIAEQIQIQEQHVSSRGTKSTRMTDVYVTVQ